MKRLTAVLLCFLFLISGCGSEAVNEPVSPPEPSASFAEAEVTKEPPKEVVKADVTSDEIPSHNGQAYTVVNGNQPYFTEDEYTETSFEKYSELDSLGRCGTAYANIGKDIMPTEKRESIGSVKPSGWHTVKYDFVDGKYLYNRCHLIGFQLSGENANEKNLITGTRYMNVQGMLPFENMVADYVKETDNHVLLRVTPVYTGDNLVADGVLMEAFSVEDKGDGICYNVFCYNIQPGVVIDYSDGSSKLEEKKESETVVVPTEKTSEKEASEPVNTYVGNKNTKKFHSPFCKSVKDMKEANKQLFECTRNEMINLGYTACGICNP